MALPVIDFLSQLAPEWSAIDDGPLFWLAVAGTSDTSRGITPRDSSSLWGGISGVFTAKSVLERIWFFLIEAQSAVLSSFVVRTVTA